MPPLFESWQRADHGVDVDGVREQFIVGVKPEIEHYLVEYVIDTRGGRDAALIAVGRPESVTPTSGDHHSMTHARQLLCPPFPTLSTIPIAASSLRL